MYTLQFCVLGLFREGWRGSQEAALTFPWAVRALIPMEGSLGVTQRRSDSGVSAQPPVSAAVPAAPRLELAQLIPGRMESSQCSNSHPSRAHNTVKMDWEAARIPAPRLMNKQPPAGLTRLLFLTSISFVASSRDLSINNHSQR